MKLYRRVKHILMLFNNFKQLIMYDLMTSILAVCPSDAIIGGFNHVKGTKAHTEWSDIYSEGIWLSG